MNLRGVFLSCMKDISTHFISSMKLVYKQDFTGNIFCSVQCTIIHGCKMNMLDKNASVLRVQLVIKISVSAWTISLSLNLKKKANGFRPPP